MAILRFAPPILILACSACAGKSVSTAPLPSDPVTAVQQFLAGVKANNLAAMGDVWGSDRGPANSWMEASMLHQRLAVMQRVLAFQTYSIGQDGVQAGRSNDERIVHVQLSRNGCTPVVPFTTRRYRDGWIVSAIDLDAAGNPQRSCGS
jgi:hypothetical protein